MSTAVIYARFSCSKQREASIDDQLRVCREWCARECYAIVAEYCDYAISGRTDERPEFQRMIDRAGESNIVLVYMMDRFSRDQYDAPIYKKRLREKGVRVLSATESMPDGPESILLEKIYEGMAAVESLHISMRTKRSMEGNALKCLYNGDRVYGYTVDDSKHYIVDEKQAAIVRDVFGRRLQGESINLIARAMADKGVTTYRGKPCSYTMIQTMLKNPRYKGVYKWGEIEIDGGMPAIIDKETWTMAQQVKSKKQRKNEEWSEFILSGRAICGGCGRNLVGVSGRNSRNVKYNYYRCSKRCGEVSPVAKDWLEDKIAESLREFVSDRTRAVEIARVVAEHAKSDKITHDVERARETAQKASNALDNIQRAIEQGVFTESTNARIEELTAQRDRALAFIEHSKQFDFSVDELADFLQYGSTLSDRQMIDALVWQISLTDEEIIVTLNYDVAPDVPQRITLDGFAKELEWDKKERTPQVSDVRTEFEWLPTYALMRTMRVIVHSGKLAFVINRAA